ncbi:MAG: hypothetical protein HN846_01240 [Candidatus Pacebacteria bacterium]|jgi:hypothetical protein|nr:hypothetical protein [Candidatus Paceibacterota bacterium]MBT3511829.1 hypothetical protein [Candidatus Paceibacterota bacterium]MBT4004621.1 hypothetical protein [Candidatus Paceibacterota bacterium]MBT4358349.1 hypothetical protein [Candidatus Paceibacterota bacterium]MBT4681397.1 hypothetical protein [Candidatus Paceibacterota bacterium]
MTKILIRILFLASIVGGGIFFAKQKEIAKNSKVVTDIEDKREQIQGSVKGVTDTVSEQTQELTTRGQEVSEHISKILESYIKPTDSVTNDSDNNNSSESSSSNESNSSNDEGEVDKPIYEETLDYGRYLYCQQVIKDYDTQHP